MPKQAYFGLIFDTLSTYKSKIRIILQEKAPMTLSSY